MSSVNFVLSRVEHEKRFYNLEAWWAGELSCDTNQHMTKPTKKSMSSVKTRISLSHPVFAVCNYDTWFLHGND